MAEIIFKNGKFSIDKPLYQWDKNITLRIKGLSLPSTPEIHFSNSTMGGAIVKTATVEDDVVVVTIPNGLLQVINNLKVYVCFYQGEEFTTNYKFILEITPREKPGDYTLQDDEDVYSFNELKALVESYKDQVDGKIQEAKTQIDTDFTVRLDTQRSEIDAEIARVEAQANAKYETVNERVNNLVATDPGSTGDNAELLDIRVGSDGKTYPTAGDAVRVQVSELKGDLGELDNAINPILEVGDNLLNVMKLTHNYYVDSKSGNLISYNGWSVSDFIKCEAWDKFVLLVVNSNGEYVPITKQDLYVGFYDENKNPTAGGIGSPIYASRSNDRYFRVSTKTSNFDSSKLPMVVKYEDVSKYVTSSDYVPFQRNIGKFITDINNNFSAIEESLVFATDKKGIVKTNFEDELSLDWLNNANTSYEEMMNYIRSTNSYDCAYFLVETDSHGRDTVPFDWIQTIDRNIPCVHLGDIVTDYYNEDEISYYRKRTSNIKNLITLVGNHDAHYNVNGGQGNQFDLIRSFNSTNRKVYDGKGTFIVDDDDKRIRYICLNPYQIIEHDKSCALTTDEFMWVYEEIKNSKFDIVFLSHNLIQDANTVDRNGNSGASHVGGPYATMYNELNVMLKAFKDKTTTSIWIDGKGQITFDFTNVEVDLICNLSGHVHHEIYRPKNDTSKYLAYAYDWFGNNKSCTFTVIDKTNKKLVFFKFDSNSVYDRLELDY